MNENNEHTDEKVVLAGDPNEANSEEKLERVVARIRDLERKANLLFALEIGKIIVEELFGGVEGWNARQSKDASFRKLANREDLPFGKDYLHRAVSAHLMVVELELDVSTWRHITFSHFRSLNGLPQKKQAQLLASAETEKWTTKKTKIAADNLRKKSTRGKKKDPAYTKGLKQVLAGIAVASQVDSIPVEELTQWQRNELKKVLQDVEVNLNVLTSLKENLKSRMEVSYEE